MSSKRDAAVEEVLLVRQVAVPTLPVVMLLVGHAYDVVQARAAIEELRAELREQCVAFRSSTSPLRVTECSRLEGTSCMRSGGSKRTSGFTIKRRGVSYLFLNKV
jgi:hypothetical protein